MKEKQTNSKNSGYIFNQPLLLILFIALISLLPLAAFSYEGNVSDYTDYVNAPQLNVRSGPGTSYSVIGKLNQGKSVKVTHHHGVWRQIVWMAGRPGYVSGNYLKSSQGVGFDTGPDPEGLIAQPTSPPASPANSGSTPTATSQPASNGPSNVLNVSDYTAVVTASALNVRSGPGTQYGIIGTRYRDSTVKVTHQQDNWLRIEWPGRAVAYVHGNYLKRSSVVEGVADPEGLQAQPSVAPDSDSNTPGISPNSIDTPEEIPLATTNGSGRNLNSDDPYSEPGYSPNPNASPTDEDLLRRVHDRFGSLTGGQYWHHQDAESLFDQTLGDLQAPYPDVVEATHRMFGAVTHDQYWDYIDGPNDVKFVETVIRVNSELYLPGTDWYEGCDAAKDVAEKIYNDRSQSPCSPQDRLSLGLLLLDVASAGSVNFGRQVAERLAREAAEQAVRETTKQLRKKVAQEIEEKLLREIGVASSEFAEEVGEEAIKEIANDVAKEFSERVAWEVTQGSAGEIAKQYERELAGLLEQKLIKRHVREEFAIEASKEAAEEIVESIFVEILEENTQLAPG